MSGSRPPSPIRDQIRRTPSWLPLAALLLLLALAVALVYRASTSPAAHTPAPVEVAPGR